MDKLTAHEMNGKHKDFGVVAPEMLF